MKLSTDFIPAWFVTKISGNNRLHFPENSHALFTKDKNEAFWRMGYTEDLYTRESEVKRDCPSLFKRASRVLANSIN